jgi:predicted nucleotidyltransferase
MLDQLEKHRPAIENLCRQFGVKRLELIGSAARGDFDPATSDFDFLVDYLDIPCEDASIPYFGLLHGLEDLLGRRIDLVERVAVKNPYFLKVADQHRDLLYAA